MLDIQFFTEDYGNEGAASFAEYFNVMDKTALLVDT